MQHHQHHHHHHHLHYHRHDITTNPFSLKLTCCLVNREVVHHRHSSGGGPAWPNGVASPRRPQRASPASRRNGGADVGQDMGAWLGVRQALGEVSQTSVKAGFVLIIPGTSFCVGGWSV